MNSRRLIITVALTATFVALPALAASNFVPIAPVPGANGGNATDAKTIGDYINSLFKLALAVGATLAVIFIAVGGFEYMLTEALPGKVDGKKRIQQALFGLAILLLVFLVLYVINPDIVSLRLLSS